MLVWKEHKLEMLSEQVFEVFMIAIAWIRPRKSIQMSSTAAGENGISKYIFSLSLSPSLVISSWLFFFFFFFGRCFLPHLQSIC